MECDPELSQSIGTINSTGRLTDTPYDADSNSITIRIKQNIKTFPNFLQIRMLGAKPRKSMGLGLIRRPSPPTVSGTLGHLRPLGFFRRPD